MYDSQLRCDVFVAMSCVDGRQGRVEIVDDLTHEDRMSVEILTTAGSIEQLEEIVVQHDERTNNNQLRVTIRVVRSELFYSYRLR